MRKLFMLGAVLAAVALPTASHAQFTLGLRVGYAIASGDAYSEGGQSAKMSDGVKSQVPIQLDAGYRLTPEFTLGAYFSYGFGQVGGSFKDTCDAIGLDCSAKGYRLGLQGTYAFTKVSPSFVPWVGAGTGWEWASATAEGFGLKQEDSFSGWEFLNLQVGGDWKLSPQFALGPYVMYSLGQYSSGTMKFTGDPDINVFDTADKEMHSWFSFGVRGKFDL